jgi:hypothetical protein
MIIIVIISHEVCQTRAPEMRHMWQKYIANFGNRYGDIRLLKLIRSNTFTTILLHNVQGYYIPVRDPLSQNTGIYMSLV